MLECAGTSQAQLSGLGYHTLHFSFLIELHEGIATALLLGLRGMSVDYELDLMRYQHFVTFCQRYQNRTYISDATPM